MQTTPTMALSLPLLCRLWRYLGRSGPFRGAMVYHCVPCAPPAQATQPQAKRNDFAASVLQCMFELVYDLGLFSYLHPP